jgi:tetratricopeptide (TPR) repeat protein
LALGESGQALAAFSTANEQSNLPALETWIAGLTSGDLNRTMLAYNKALNLANAGQWTEALQEVTGVLAQFPDFIPAGRLKGLVLAGAGRVAEARLAWEEALRQCTDDPILRSYLEVADGQLTPLSQNKRPRSSVARVRQLAIGAAAGVTLTLAGLYLFSTEGDKARRPSPVAAAESGAGPSSPDRSTLAGILGVALSEQEDSIAALVEAVGVDTSRWDPTARTHGRNVVQEAGWRHYKSGVKAARNSHLDLAVAELRRATEMGVRAFYHDDALYGLALLYDRTGNQPDAQRTARTLLETYPGSVFANSIIRRLARTTGETDSVLTR